MEKFLRLQNNHHAITVEDEAWRIYTSAPSKRLYSYEKEHTFGGPGLGAPTSAYGIRYGAVKAKHSCLIVASGGPTAVGKKSALLHDDLCIVVIGPFMATLVLPELDLKWCSKVDWCSCIGVYHAPRYQSYVSHGECDITRVSYWGEIIWSSGGKDIFTGDVRRINAKDTDSQGFTLYEDHVIAEDFNGERYWIDLETGHSTLLKDTE